MVSQASRGAALEKLQRYERIDANAHSSQAKIHGSTNTWKRARPMMQTTRNRGIFFVCMIGRLRFHVLLPVTCAHLALCVRKIASAAARLPDRVLAHVRPTDDSIWLVMLSRPPPKSGGPAADATT